MLDPFTLRLQTFLSATSFERSFSDGAEMLLQLNGNRVMYRNLLRTQDERLLTYELNKHLRYRLDGLTRLQVVELDRRVTLAAARTVSAPTADTVPADRRNPVPAVLHRGRRPDHDSLPEEIRALYDGQADRYKKIRALHFQLKGMRDAKSCDRYEILVILADLDKTYRANWEKYDGYKVSNDLKDLNDLKGLNASEHEAPASPPKDIKDLKDLKDLKEKKGRSPHAMAVSRNLKKLEGDRETTLTDNELKENIILAVRALRKEGGDISDRQRERIAAAGINLYSDE